MVPSKYTGQLTVAPRLIVTYCRAAVLMTNKLHVSCHVLEFAVLHSQAT